MSRNILGYLRANETDVEMIVEILDFLTKSVYEPDWFTVAQKQAQKECGALSID